MDENLPLLLAGVVTFVFGWNNSGLLIGNERGSGTLSAAESTVLCSIGMLLGVALEGPKMTKSLGGIISTPTTDTVVLATLLVSIVLTFGLTLGRIPVTFSATMVGAFAGAAFVSSAHVRVGDLATIIVFWMLAPLATMAATFLSYKVIQRATANLSLVSVDAFNRAGVGLVSLALAYVLAANNIGMIYGTSFIGSQPSSADSVLTLLVLAAVAVVAMALFGRGSVAGTVGDRLLSLSPQGVLAAFSGTIIVMLVATQLGIPVSVTQCLVGGMFGAAYTKKIAIVNRRLSLEVVASWVVIPLAAFFLAALVTPLL
ncbi:MAG TPA: inorganic phosphate transporter [Nitrososphaerales archaeon]|nr:inorganic phosphate transporter [Nitrososphaerales archaeon]